ncbi:putative transcriptional regulator YozG, Cro/CI family [Candidatus Syntrophocurvum alkaliphilum]|uniref:Putative transcriptional regulator YozG, Cro/CI family n=1 Tax=Candidatus Syntrophocurvum alkaliphilum TaxID=2293317 RepID=A0A6I6DFZ7_9FIRM|nr:helix-turn-helix transcriptional regulator [Candidatus Syntrophocurvum alkaliphilum]QGT99303.1 putative transcriptional regulator YozG, Cro/CI family [Candidatus Syntrophocurvum alkaliphilum]
MIRIKLAEVMGKKRIKQKALSEQTGIRPNTISDMWYEKSKRIDLNYLDKLCEVLECQPGDLLEYVPDNKE